MAYHRALSDLQLNMGNESSKGSENCRDQETQYDVASLKSLITSAKIEVSFKKSSPDVKTPEYKTEGSSGMDLCAYIEDGSVITITPGQRTLVKTGISMVIPSGFEGQVRPRSGLALKNGITVLNTPGTIDSDYRGEIGIILVNHSQESFNINNGDRIAQIIFSPVIKANLSIAENLDETIRGEGGFGSTGVTNE